MKWGISLGTNNLEYTVIIVIITGIIVFSGSSPSDDAVGASGRPRF